MKFSSCFLKECDNYNGDFDCIMHYTKIQNEAMQRITLHYNALKLKMQEVMDENSKYEEEAKKKCKNQFDNIYKIIKGRADNFSSPETSNSAFSPPRQTRSSSSNGSNRSALKNGKENSPARRVKSRNGSSKESLKDAGISIDPKPVKEKRTRQTKLPFFTTPFSNKKRRSEEIDDDMTYCEELEGRMPNQKTEANTSLNKLNSTGVFNFGNLPRHHKNEEKKSSPQNEFSPQKVIKQENEESSRKIAFPPPSPELFLSDMDSHSNSVVFVEPSEKEIITIPDRTYNPERDIVKEIEKELKETRKKRLFEDSQPFAGLKRESKKEPKEKRYEYEGECMDCQIFYDNVAEKKSISDANNDINNCPIKCDGWKERTRKLRKSDKPRKNGTVVIKCNSKFARRRKEETSADMTAPGIWDLNVEPRKSKPLFSKNTINNNNYETPDL